MRLSPSITTLCRVIEVSASLVTNTPALRLLFAFCGCVAVSIVLTACGSADQPRGAHRQPESLDAESGSSRLCPIRGVPNRELESLGIRCPTAAEEYAACVSAAETNLSQIQACRAHLTAAGCKELLHLASGSISCAEAMTVASVVHLLDPIEPRTVHGFLCYDGATKITCSNERASFTARFEQFMK